MATIKIPSPLRAYTDNEAVIEVSGDTIGAALTDLTGRYPELRNHLYEGGEFREINEQG